MSDKKDEIAKVKKYINGIFLTATIAVGGLKLENNNMDWYVYALFSYIVAKRFLFYWGDSLLNSDNNKCGMANALDYIFIVLVYVPYVFAASKMGCPTSYFKYILFATVINTIWLFIGILNCSNSDKDTDVFCKWIIINLLDMPFLFIGSCIMSTTCINIQPLMVFILFIILFIDIFINREFYFDPKSGDKTTN